MPFRCLNESHENGRYHYNEDENISAFEDLQSGHAEPSFYAWRGDWDAHDAAQHSPEFANLRDATDWVRDNA